MSDPTRPTTEPMDLRFDPNDDRVEGDSDANRVVRGSPMPGARAAACDGARQSRREAWPRARGRRVAPQIMCGAAALLVAFACSSGTGGREVPIVATFAGDPSFANTLTSTGWEVTLTRARLVVGPLHAFSPDDERHARAFAPGAWLAAWRPHAYAHPGHDHRIDGRRVRAEVLAQIEVDALDDTPQRAEGWAEVGRVDGARIGLTPTTEFLFGRQAEVAGEARRGDAVVRFSAALELPNETAQRRVLLPVEGDLDEGSVLAVTLDPRVWLDGVAFDQFEGCDPCSFASDSQAHAAWRLGVRNPGAYEARILAPEMSR